MKINISNIAPDDISKAIEIYTNSFIDDPLFLFAFPEIGQRKGLTKIMYEFVVNNIVPKLNLIMKGAYIDANLVGCIIYTTPESFGWNETMNDAIEKMREKANDPKINLIGEYARLEGYDPRVEHFYGNEIAVIKDFRKRGIARALADVMVDDCKNHPTAKGIEIDTANPNNIPLYEKWGWELKQTVEFYNIKKYFLWREK